MKKASSSSSTKGQKSILGFFQKKASEQQKLLGPSGTTTLPIGSPKKKLVPKAPPRATQNLTPAPSSDAVEADEDEDVVPTKGRRRPAVQSPMTPASLDGAVDSGLAKEPISSPSRKTKKAVNYAESSNGEGDSDIDTFVPAPKPSNRSLKRRKTTDNDDDNFSQGSTAESEEVEDDFIAPDDSEEELPSRKRKRSTPKQISRKASQESKSDEDLQLPVVSTATQWTYDPENPEPLQPRSNNIVTKKTAASAKKTKAHVTEPEKRYPWLATLSDADRHPPDHPEYDPRTVYIPPMAWQKFSPFEKQYWEIKKDLWDTIVFFKKGKFYELYENDATIGHQLFDLKLTDRVNMRMVGVPEMSLDHWANQFVAKGYKIARVDQKETALGKEMRERDGAKSAKAKKEDKVIHRELACILTAGTLVEGSMLQDDMATYCVSIKESAFDEQPVFGIAFIDAATGQFFLSEFVDDIDLTKFETFVAQTRPQELLVEKSNLSTKALRILKNNTGPTTLWNNLKPGKEFWEADRTIRELESGDYFSKNDKEEGESWPEALKEAKNKEAVMSALGALIHYLRVLKIESDLLSLGNFSWYDPIRKATSLVLDGQTLINLEIFTNSFDGGINGTLFTMLNRCVTPFGKRMFKQWVCHPLADSDRINMRLDAVDALNADTATRDQFISSLTKMPDLERLLSRIHAGTCKAQDFVRVLEGFEQIEYTMGLLGEIGSGDGLLGQLISSMPDLAGALEPWKTSFDHGKAKEDGLLVPEPGVEEDFDQSQENIEQIHKDLDSILHKARKNLGSSAIVFRDNGKEIYQLEVPLKIKNIPSNWSQMSATKAVKRWYSPELKVLVRKLQEAQETHAQIVKDVASRFYARFDEEYLTWLSAIKVVAQLDCLISLAKASSALGEPCCRPSFVEDERSVLEFEDLRHPCMLNNVMDFIPNDVKLGGESPNINVLTGANAAGKSTILRMTCIAVIMAQIGCYVPCSFARLSPVDRIMSRLGANDNIFASQSTFFVELSETKKILSEATPRSLVILDELGRGTSSYDGVAVAEAVLHQIASHLGCIGFFATHYHSLAEEFKDHPEIQNKRMKIHVDNANRKITFLYKLENGIAEGSFGMHCAAMCGISDKVIERAEVAARDWEHTSRLNESLETARSGCYVPLGVQSDVAWCLKEAEEVFGTRSLDVLRQAIETL